MIGLDTNVLLRVLVDDGNSQTTLARNYLAARCSAANPAFINDVVLAEAVWVLDRRYAYGKPQIVRTIETLLASPEIAFPDRNLVRSAVRTYARHSVGFADALIVELNRACGCPETVTFDRKAEKLEGFAPVR